MGRRGPFRWGLALAVVLVAQHTLANEPVCRTGCRGVPQNFKYAIGTTYRYNYEGRIAIDLSSAEGQETSTEVKAVVLLTQQADCNQVLRVQNIEIQTSKGKFTRIPDLEKPIRINFNDGQIEDSICVESGDTQNSINIKRAIASLFQANLKNSYETDIFGVCPTDIAHHKEGNILVIQKSRNLNKCAYRDHIRHDFVSTAFNLNSEIKSSPILNSDYNAKLRVKSGIVEQVNAVENYLYLPFSVGKNGAKAQVVSKLQLAGTSRENPQTRCNQPRSIIFDNPHPVVAPTSNINIILTAVKEVAKTIDIVVGEHTAKEFVTLIKTVRVSKKDDLLAVYNQVKSGAGFTDKAAAKKLFLDALLQAGTGDTIEVAITLLKNNELNEIERALVYVGLSAVGHATESSLSTAATLLSQGNVPYEAYLGIGNLAGTYCRQHSCDNVAAVNQLTQKFIDKLSNGKARNREEEKVIIYVLKGLANFRRLSKVVVAKITTIAQDKKASNRLRVAALETYLADPCNDQIRNSALNILKDIQQDSEVRIKAYLVVAQCPNANIGIAVKALLEKEPSYQVGGFIVSHIRNLKASANPDKSLAKQYLGFSVPKKFPIDLRKWSYNGEFSYAIDTLGIAASTEANIIYSQDSFLPRSTSLNLTAELFGHTFNFLEIQTRQENLDRLVEHYFGPKGLLRTSSLGEVWKNEEEVTKVWKHLEERLKTTLRRRRDVSRAEIENIGRAVQIKENELNKDLDLDLSIRTFGSEIAFINVNTYQKTLTPEAIVEKIVDGFSKGLDKLKRFEETLRANLLLLDVELAYPTNLGFPLRLAVDVTSNIQVVAKGGLDVRALEAGKDSNIHIQVIPSVNIEAAGRLTLDALVVEDGLKVVSTLYTSTGGDLTVNLFNERRGIDIKFGLPVQEQKLISVNHEIVFHTREQTGQEINRPLKFAQAKDFSICLDQLNPFIGLTFCGDINGPNLAGKDKPVLPFPLAGDAKIAVTIENNDVSAYHFRHVVNNAHTGAELILETIGKNRQRKTSFQVTTEISPEKYIKAVFTSPVKSASAEARITLTPRETSLLLRAGSDTDANQYRAKIGVDISGSQSRAVYKPIVEFQAPGLTNLPRIVQGEIIVESQGQKVKYILNNFKVAASEKKQYTITGNFGYEKQNPFIDIEATDGQIKAAVKGLVLIDPNLIKYNAQFTNTFNPDVNFHVQGDLKRSPDQYNSYLQIIHGSDLSSKTNIITLTDSITNIYKNPRDFVIGTKHELTYPLLNIDSKVAYKQTPKSLEYDLDVGYANVKFGSELEIKVNEKEDGDFDIELEVYGLDNKVKFKAERQVQGEESKISNELEINGRKLEVDGKVKHRIRPSNIDVGANLTVILPEHNTPFKVNSGLVYNPNELDVHHKVTSGSTVIIDAFLKANKAGNANGSIKVNIKNILVVNGQLKANKGSGTGDILIDAQQIKKQVKIDSKFQIQEQVPSIYNIDVNIYPSYREDKNQKIILSTHNRIEATGVDSKNQIQILNKKLELNFKGARTGNDKNGKFSGEVEVTLPNDQYVLGRVNSDYKVANEVLNGQSQASLEYRTNKNAAGRKVSVKTVYKDTNPKEGVYDVEYILAADDSNGKNINSDIGFKTSKHGDVGTLEIRNKVYGSIIKNPVQATLRIEGNDEKGNYEVTSSYGPSATLKLLGKYDLPEDGKPISGSVELKITSPSKALKTLDIGASGSLLSPENPSGTFQVQGSLNIFADDEGTPSPIIDFKTEGLIKATQRDGEIRGSVSYGNLDPIRAVAGYSQTETGKQRQLKGNVDIHYGKGKNLKADASVARTGNHQYKLEAEINSPSEQYKNTKLIVATKRSEDNRQVTSNVKIISDGKVWTLDSEFVSSDLSPLIDIKLTGQEGTVSRFYIKGNKVTEKQFSGELIIIAQKQNLVLEGDLDVNVENIQQFSIKSNINAPILKLDKISFEALSKPAKTGRRILVTIKSSGKNIVTGSTSYETREEQGKYVVEGSGSFKVREETLPANFKYIVQQLSTKRNGEEGIEITFDAGLGTKAIDAELKISNKQFRIQNSYCEAKKECAHIEIDAKTSVDDIESFNQEVEINVDLRKLGLSHEFGLKSVTNRKNYLLDHTVDVHFQSNENSKYQYSVSVHPNEAGISFTTPRRVIALEAKTNVPDTIRQGGKVSGEVFLYLDKRNQPDTKAGISGWFNLDVQGQNVNGEVRVTYPKIQRPLLATIRTTHSGTTTNGDIKIISELDVFAQPNQKVTLTYRAYSSTGSKTAKTSKTSGNTIVGESLAITSPGLGINIFASEELQVDRQTYSGEYVGKVKYHVGNTNYDNVFSIKGGKTQFNVLVKLLNIDLLKVTNRLTINKENQVIESEISSYDRNPLVSTLEIKNFNSVTYTAGFRNNQREKVQFNSALIPGQIADVRADHITGTGKINLFQATIKLDEANFLKPDYSVNSKEVEKVLDQGRQKFTTFVNGLQNIETGWSNDIRKEINQLTDISRRAVPNLQPLKNYYVTELDKIKSEILADPSIRELSEFFQKIFGAVLNSLGEVFKQLSDLVEKVTQSIQAVFAGVIESIDKELIPQLKTLAETLTRTASEISKTVVEIVSGYLTLISQLIERYQPEIKALAATFGELGQDVGRFVLKAYEHITRIITQTWRDIYNEIKALPIFEELKAQYDEFITNGLPNAEGVINAIQEISATIKDTLPQDCVVYKEVVEIIDIISEYLQKKISGQRVDDFGVLERLIQVDIRLTRKLLSFISAPGTDIQRPDVPVSIDLLKKLPKLVAVKFSPTAYLLEEDTSEEIVTFLLTLLNKPRQWFPPFPLFGMVVQGQHIFTFDGKHLTFPGNCKYLLARDAVNGNFTIIGTYSNGLLNAITLATQQNSITLKKGGQVLLNNAASELPVRKPDIAAFRGYNIIILKSDVGVTLHCTPDLLGCSVSISGFYHAQVKGLLGNGNNEPYDDFTIPSGAIVTTGGDFGNSYKIGNCQLVSVPEHENIQNDVCNRLFSWESPLRYCFPFVNTDNFKTACAHGLAAGVKDTEEAIAKSYVAVCNERNIPISVPSELVRCTNSDKPYAVGDKFSIKVPTKAADIVLLVDTAKGNEQIYSELVQPLVQEIGKELNTRGINDIDIHLIIYGGENQWPSHVTVNGKLTFRGKAPNLKFTETPKREPIPDGVFSHSKPYIETLENIIYDLSLAFGQNLEARTYSEALEYPFRAQAVKSIIVATSRPCEVGKFLVLQKLRTLFYKNNLISLNLITPFDELNVKDIKKTKDVVGFNTERVFTISQAKKKPEGVAELYKDLQYDDYCVDYTIKNRGNVFVADNFINGKPDIRKQFIHTAAHNIVIELVNIEEGLDCECKLINPYNAVNVCREVYAKERPLPARKGAIKG